jgi:hypothetical protein
MDCCGLLTTDGPDKALTLLGSGRFVIIRSWVRRPSPAPEFANLFRLLAQLNEGGIFPSRLLVRDFSPQIALAAAIRLSNMATE